MSHIMSVIGKYSAALDFTYFLHGNILVTALLVTEIKTYDIKFQSYFF